MITQKRKPKPKTRITLTALAVTAMLCSIPSKGFALQDGLYYNQTAKMNTAYADLGTYEIYADDTDKAYLLTQEIAVWDKSIQDQIAGETILLTDADHIAGVTLMKDGQIIKSPNWVISGLFDASQLYGECWSDTNIINISSRQSPENCITILCHELGHQIDTENGGLSKGMTPEEVQNVVELSAKVSGCDNREHIASSTQEAFAESFWLYLYYPDELRECAPRIAQIFDNL